LDYLEDSLAFLPKIDGFSKRRLRLLLDKYEKNSDDFLDIRTEIEIIRYLHSYGVSPIYWEPKDEKPHPDVVFNFNGSPVNIEVTRIRRAREEEQLDEQCYSYQEARRAGKLTFRSSSVPGYDLSRGTSRPRRDSRGSG
jgi:hypothetical protein